MHTLIIDTSFGSTVGFLNHEPIIETDSRTHVERLTPNIARAAQSAGIQPAQITRIIAGTGPAPFTGLRAGIVTARAIAYATGATLLGQDILTPQVAFMRAIHDGDPRLSNDPRLATIPPRANGTRYLTLAVNDARRRQLYFLLADGTEPNSTPLIAMDIDYPVSIAQRVNSAIAALAQQYPDERIVVDIVGHGAQRYASQWQDIEALGSVLDASVLDFGAPGLAIFAECALDDEQEHARAEALEPLYLRRPDVSVPKPLKPVLHEATTTESDMRS